MTESADVYKRVEDALATNERYRSRARNVSSLTAASTAALAVGLVLAPPGTLPHNAQVTGLTSVILLLAATCILVASSVARAKVGIVTGFRKFIRALSISGTRQCEVRTRKLRIIQLHTLPI